MFVCFSSQANSSMFFSDCLKVVLFEPIFSGRHIRVSKPSTGLVDHIYEMVRRNTPLRSLPYSFQRVGRDLLFAIGTLDPAFDDNVGSTG